MNRNGTDELFFEGLVLPARGRSPQARRFNFISRADALIAVSGTNGTEQQLALANALDLPILPIPTFGGAARAFWLSHREEICERLRLKPATADRLQDSPPSAALAEEFTSVLVAALERRCFVIMPFANEEPLNNLYDQAIARAVDSFGDRCIRLDREGIPGNAGQQIEQGIATCDYAVAVFDQMSPNVFYELGLAHAQCKPVIIIWSTKERTTVPFDITMHQRIDYDDVNDALTERICKAIRQVSPLLRDVDYPH